MACYNNLYEVLGLKDKTAKAALAKTCKTKQAETHPDRHRKDTEEVQAKNLDLYQKYSGICEFLQAKKDEYDSTTEKRISLHKEFSSTHRYLDGYICPSGFNFNAGSDSGSSSFNFGDGSSFNFNDYKFNIDDLKFDSFTQGECEWNLDYTSPTVYHATKTFKGSTIQSEKGWIYAYVASAKGSKKFIGIKDGSNCKDLAQVYDDPSTIKYEKLAQYKELQVHLHFKNSFSKFKEPKVKLKGEGMSKIEQIQRELVANAHPNKDHLFEVYSSSGTKLAQVTKVYDLNEAYLVSLDTTLYFVDIEG